MAFPMPPLTAIVAATMPTSSKKPLQRRHIEALVAVGDSQSVHRAARELGMPQPVLSRLLGEAETLIGARLFERSSHGSEPTSQGRTVLARARFVLRMIERLNDVISDTAPPIQLGCIPRAMHTLVPRLLARVYPEAGTDTGMEAGTDAARHDVESGWRFQVREGVSTTLFDAVAAGELDFAIVRGGTHVVGASDELVVERLYDERTVVFCAAGNPAVPAGAVPLSRLAGASWTLPEKDTHSRIAFEAFWNEHDLPGLRPVIETRSFEASLALVAATRLVSIAPESIVRRHVDFGVLRIVKVRRALPSNPVMLAYSRMAEEDPVLSSFRQMIHDTARTLVLK
jgi:DNA-binding transcriptional LysR family regulator